MKTLLFVLAATALMGAGKCSRKPVPEQNAGPLVQLDMYGCRGFCPTYQLIFRNDALVQYEGKRNMVKMGIDSVTLTKSELAALRNKLVEVNLWQYPERIESRVADAPNSMITVFDGSRQHSVTGSIDRPKPILELEALMKDLAETHGLKVKEGVNPYAPPPNQQEIAVKFKPEVNPGNFLIQIEEIRLRIVKRISAENEWVIGYNPDQISEGQLIDLLKAMDGVISARPNK